MNTVTSGKRHLFLIPWLCGLPSLLKIVVKRDCKIDSPMTSFSLQSPFIPWLSAEKNYPKSRPLFVVEMFVSLPFPMFAF